MKRRGWIKLGVFSVLAGSVVAAGTAFARGKGGWGCHGKGGAERAEYMKTFVTARIDEALDEAKVTGPARETVYASRDRVFKAFEEAHKDRGPEHIEEALTLFEADRLDVSAIEKHRAEKQASMQKIGDEVTQALIDVHEALTPEQRKALTAYVREMKGRHGGWGK